MGYPKGGKIAHGSGKIVGIKNKEFKHNIPTDLGSSGSPIILLDNSKVIGVHKKGIYSEKLNLGTFIGEILDKLKANNINNIAVSKKNSKRKKAKSTKKKEEKSEEENEETKKKNQKKLEK